MTKKLLLLATLFLAFACSKDDDTGVDPIIGNWSRNNTITEVTMGFNSNGSGNQNITPLYEGVSETLNSSFTWRNKSSDPDFKSSMQEYIIDGDNIYANFYNNFRSLSIRFNEAIEWTMSKN